MGEGDSDKRTFAAMDVWLRERENHEPYVAAFITKANEPRKLLNTKSSDKHFPQLKDVLQAEQRRVSAFVNKALSAKMGEVTEYLMVIAQRLLELYHKSKAAHGYMDYDDLILSTVELLYRSGVAAWVLYKLDGGIDHLLVDEAQDTSPEQWKLVDILASEFFAGESARSSQRTLFVVGDEKQSIYSFQGAAPHAFDDMQKRLSKRAEGADKIFKRVRLALSFRSTTPVLRVVDSVFAQPAARDGLVFTEEDISHDVHRKEAAGRVELWPLQEAALSEAIVPWHVPQQPSHSLKPEILTARQVAATIGGWLKEKRLLSAQSRPIEPGDIIILVQRRGAFADAMLRALKQKEIPVSGADRLILTEHIAVMDCIALANFLLLPQDDLTLATVLKSPFVGLSEEALFELAHHRGKHTLWQQLRVSVKYQEATELLLDLLAKVDYLPPYEFFAYVLETCKGRQKLIRRLGLEAEDPLNEFLALALQYNRIHTPSLQGFLHWLQSGATEIKRDMEKGRNEVRIMTVHGAKGLQAPIVFLPDTTRPPRYDSAVLWTRTEERLPLWSPAAAYEDAHYKKLKEQHRLDADREYRRLLYVAMTRAEDELYICGWKGSKPIPANCWYELARQGMESVEGIIKEDEKLLLSSSQLSQAVQPALSESNPTEIELPSWTESIPADEPTPPKPLAPSRLEPESGNMLSPLKDSKRRERGLLIHRLLQYMPDVAQEQRVGVMERFMQRYGVNFTSEERDTIAVEVAAILDHPEFAPVFALGSLAEVAVTGTLLNIHNKSVVIAGQIDRLSVQGDHVYIIDYKTNREIPLTEAHIPLAYLRQMDAYRQLISSIYPDKTVHCALLWTAAPKLMTLSNAIWESYAA
jgi:ATP-dependent helicase/nuclease subunit A